MEERKENKEIEIRSEAVQEVMSHIPNWMIRWGTTLVFVVVLMLIFLSWMIKYPDVIKGNITITTETPPSRIVVQQNGIIKSVGVKNGDQVKKGQTLAVLQSQLDETAAEIVLAIIDTLKLHLKNEDLGPFYFPEELPNFGDVQEGFNKLRIAANDFFRLTSSSIYADRVAYLSAQINNHERLLLLFDQQRSIAEKELVNALEKRRSDSVLYTKDVISKMEFFKSQSNHADKQLALQEIKRKTVENNITKTELEKQLFELEYEQSEKVTVLKQEIQEALSLVKDHMMGWQLNYVLKAPFDGTTDLLHRFNENDYIAGGTPLLAVLPKNTALIGYAEISARGIGKLEKGQRVNIQLANYPAHEFGQLVGEVASISEIPQNKAEHQDGGYIVQVILPQGLITTYNKQLELRAEMFGSAEIVTEDARIIERIFNQFKSLFDR
jgi:multidrug resistance efflux pump